MLQITSFVCLKSLNLSGCTNMRDKTFASIIKGLPNLHSLNISFTTLTPEGIAKVSNLPMLTFLNLDGCYQVNNACLLKIVQKCKLEWFSLAGVDKPQHIKDEEVIYNYAKYTDEAILNLAKYCGQTLVGINLYYNRAIKEETYITLLNACTQLRVACFGRSKLTEKVLQVLANKGNGLEFLNLTDCFVSDKVIEALASRHKLLQCLIFMWCSEISSNSVPHLCSLPLINSLVLTGCWKLTETDISAFAKLPHLQALEVSWCKKSPTFINGLRQKMPNTFINDGEFRVIISNVLDPSGQGVTSWENTEQVFWNNCINYQSNESIKNQ